MINFLSPKPHTPYPRNNGFTLVEMIVALSIFVVVMSLAAGGFINLLSAQRSTASIIEINNNLSLLLEQMAREIRFGSNFVFDSVNLELSFNNVSNYIVKYRLRDGVIERCTNDPLWQTGCDTVPPFYQKMTPDRQIQIEEFNVCVQYNDIDGCNLNLSGNNIPPRITIGFLMASLEKELSGIDYKIQTTVSARKIF